MLDSCGFCDVSTLFEMREILFSAHIGCSHIFLNNKDGDFIPCRDNHRLAAPGATIRTMISTLTLKDKTGFQKDAFQGLPWNGSYAW